MIRSIILSIFIIFFNIVQCILNKLPSEHTTSTCNNSTHSHPKDPCSSTAKGIIKYINDHKNLSNGCDVTLILKGKQLQLLKGNEEFKTIKLDKISAPIIILPTDNNCLLLKGVKDENTILCASNEYSCNSWWMQITRQILCNNLGPMRNEVYGESTLEEQYEDLSNLSGSKDAHGINIHMSDETIPHIKVHYNK